MTIVDCWKRGYKLKRIVEELGVSQDEALRLFTEAVNKEFFGHTSKLES